MRIRFFAAAPQLPVAPIKAVQEVEESIHDSASVTSSTYTPTEDDSTSVEDLDFEELLLNDTTPLPEMNLDQADTIKRLLLSPLEPTEEF